MSRPAKSSISAVVFDLDGTLIDSLPLVLRAFSHALEPFGPRPTMEIFARLGGPPQRVFHTLLDRSEHVPAAIERLEAFNRDHGHLIQPFTGAGVMLAQLRERGAQLAVWTGRDRGTTEELLQLHRLDALFDAVICGDDLPTHKPDPQGLREIMRRLGVGAHQTLLIGDADVDVLGGAACNMDTVLIRHAREVAGDVTAKAWRTVNSPFEAYELALGRVGSGKKQEG
ncbi:MAG TPA: HAD family hydrolase [Opitutaceae bacterium]|nr:HAD family hydrolase [Opitutaceae bacterium]